MTTKVRGSTLSVTDDNSTNQTNYILQISGVAGNVTTSSTELTFNPSTGILVATAFNSTSDEKLKDKINTIENPLDKVDQLRGVTFTWKSNGKNAIGLIAQEVEKILPEVVSETDGIKNVSYDQIVGLLVEAVKELKQEVEELKKSS